MRKWPRLRPLRWARSAATQAIHALRQAFAGATPAVRSAIAEGGILCAERLLAEGKNEQAAADLRCRSARPTSRSSEFWKRRAARSSPAASREFRCLVEQLKSPDKAMFQIGAQHGPRAAGQ